MKIKIERPVSKTVAYYSVSVNDDGKETLVNFVSESEALSYLVDVTEEFLSSAYKHHDDIISHGDFSLICGHRVQIIYRYNGVKPLREFNVVMCKKFLVLR